MYLFEFRDTGRDSRFLVSKCETQTDMIEKKITEDLPKQSKAVHNRLTHERIIDIMQDLCEIEDKELRLRIVSKLTKGGVL